MTTEQLRIWAAIVHLTFNGDHAARSYLEEMTS